MRWLLVLLVLGGCFPPPPVYRVQRAARVPRPTVPLRTGQPMSGPVAVSFGMSSAGNTVQPEGNTEAALEIPKHQGRAELKFRLGVRGELALVGESALGKATKLDDTQADVDNGQPWGIGAAVRYAIQPQGAAWSVGLDFELLKWSVPFTEIRTCVENCEDVDGYQERRNTSTEATWGIGVTPAIRVSKHVSLFGGAFLRNHPTIIRKGTEYTESNDEDTRAGPPNMLVHAGAAVDVGGVTALVLVHHNTDRDPVQYGPGIGIALQATMPDSWSTTSPSKLDEARERMRRASARRAAATAAR